MSTTDIAPATSAAALIEERSKKFGAAEEGGIVRCDACPVLCRIRPGRTGACARYANKDGFLDRVELTGYAVKQFLQMDANKDHFLNEEEFKKAAEAEQAKLRANLQMMMPAQQPRPAPAPAQPRPAQPVPAAPPGLAPGLPQGQH